MTEVTISARIPKELARELERLMREEHLEKSAALRKLLHLGLRDYRLERALAELGKGRISLSRAAADAGISVWELVEEAHRHHVTWVADDVIDDLRGRRQK
jgi:metal-responsive CopG/Arc/MetJ family transcriptional regulator